MNFNRLLDLTSAMHQFTSEVFGKSKLKTTSLESHVTDYTFPKNGTDEYFFIEVQFYKSLLMKRATLKIEVTTDYNDNGEPHVSLIWGRFPSFCFSEDAEKKDKFLFLESAVKALAFNNFDELYTKTEYTEYFSDKDCLKKVIESINDKLTMIEDFEGIYQSKLQKMMQQMNVEFAAKQFQK